MGEILNAIFMILCGIVFVCCFYILYVLTKFKYVNDEVNRIVDELDDVQKHLNKLRERTSDCDIEVVDVDRCVICGQPIPEGRFMCPGCELQHG